MIAHPLTMIFGGSRARVLETVLDVAGDMTVRQIARLAGIAPTSASSALRHLEDAGLVRGRRIGPSIAYRVNDEHYAVAALREILAGARGAEARIVDEILTHMDAEVASVILFGSVARGENEPGSDIDLLVLLPRDPTDALQHTASVTADRLTSKLGRRVNIILARKPSRRATGGAFWREVRRDGRVLYGEPLETQLRTG